MSDLVRQIRDILHGELSAGTEAIEGEQNAAERIAELVSAMRASDQQLLHTNCPYCGAAPNQDHDRNCGSRHIEPIRNQSKDRD